MHQLGARFKSFSREGIGRAFIAFITFVFVLIIVTGLSVLFTIKMYSREVRHVTNELNLSRTVCLQESFKANTISAERYSILLDHYIREFNPKADYNLYSKLSLEDKIQYFKNQVAEAIENE